jgi:hypothetical protein
MGSEPWAPGRAIEPSKVDVPLQVGVKETRFSSRPSSTTDEAGEKQQEPHTDTESPSLEGPKEGDALNDYLTGFQLFALLLCTGLVFFVILLDTSIISTVSCYVFLAKPRLVEFTKLRPSSSY